MGDVGQHHRLLLETQGLRTLRLSHHLQRDMLASLQILGPIDQAHAALDRFALDAKAIAIGLGMALRTHAPESTAI